MTKNEKKFNELKPLYEAEFLRVYCRKLISLKIKGGYVYVHSNPMFPPSRLTIKGVEESIERFKDRPTAKI